MESTVHQPAGGGLGLGCLRRSLVHDHLDVSNAESLYIVRLEAYFGVPVVVTGGVAVSYWCGYRFSRDIDILIPAFAKKARWVEAIQWQKPKGRHVDLDLVRERHDRRWGKGFCGMVETCVRESEFIDMRGFWIRVAPVRYLIYIKRKLIRMRDNPQDLPDLRNLEAI